MNFPIPEPENTIKTRAFMNAALSVSMARQPCCGCADKARGYTVNSVSSQAVTGTRGDLQSVQQSLLTHDGGQEFTVSARKEDKKSAGFGRWADLC